MSLEKPLLTFIIPAYNAENHLDECLDSLLNQTEGDHKVIVVNDGSTDHTGQIAQKYAAEYPKMFQYIEQKNQGQGVARNNAMKWVDTQYVTFLDSDDWQDCFFVEKLKKELSRHEEMPDIIFTLPWIYDSTTHQILQWHDKALFEELFYPAGGYENVPSITRNVTMPGCLRLYELEVSPCRRVFRTEFLKQINYQFLVGVKWEDVWPHFLSIHCAKHCIAMRGSGFFYRINTTHQTTASSGASRLDIAPVFDNVLQTAIRDGWGPHEIAYIIKILWNFTTWSISVTSLDYIDPVLDKLHALFKSIPKQYCKVYRNVCCNGARDWVLMNFLQSPFYKLLRDYRVRQMAGNTIAKINRVRSYFRRR